MTETRITMYTCNESDGKFVQSTYISIIPATETSSTILTLYMHR